MKDWHAQARELDTADPLASLRDMFQLPDGIAYLNGNSLGALPRQAPHQMQRVMQREWGEDLITSWSKHDWINAPIRTAARIAPLVGADPDEIILADSTSVNLFKLATAALGARPGRQTVLSEPGNFPTNLYVLESAAKLYGAELKLADREAMQASIGPDTALVALTHVHYKTADMFDMTAITSAAHDHGALALWDLSHSAGAVKVGLHAADVDLAVGCGYKYLNGGPGAPAFLYVKRSLQSDLENRVAGWMGHEAPFRFSDDFTPASGMKRWLTGTPPVLGLAALEAALSVFEGVDLDVLLDKGQRLVRFFAEMVTESCAGKNLQFVGPPPGQPRGSHVALAHPHGYAVMKTLIANGVVGDFRTPDILRFGFAPLYNRFEDAYRAASTLAKILDGEEWRHHEVALDGTTVT